MNSINHKEPLKSLFVLGTMYPDKTGGMEIFNYYFLREFLLRNERKLYYWTTNAIKGFENNHLQWHIIKPVSFFYPLQLFWTLLTKGSRISYVYTSYARQSWLLPLLSAWLFRLFKKEYIITIHSGGKPVWKPAFAYRYYFKGAKKLIGVSQAICKDYAALLDNMPVQYIPPLLPFSRSSKSRAQILEEKGLPADAQFLLYAGTLKAMKNPDIILSGWHHYKLMHPQSNLKLIMLGAGEMMAQLKQYLADNSLEEDVLLPGLQPRESMPDWYAIADYYIIGSDYEGSSVSLLEAMFNQLPVIGADSPGINAMLGHGENALLYPARNYEKLAAHISLLQEQPDLASRLATRAKSDYENNYSFKAMMKAYETIFSEVDPLPASLNQPAKESLSIH